MLSWRLEAAARKAVQRSIFRECKAESRSAQDWEPALTGQPLERGLHYRTYVGIDFVDVRVIAEPSGDVDRFEYLGDYLGRQRQVGREDHAETEREPEAQRQDVDPGFGQPQ